MKGSTPMSSQRRAGAAEEADTDALGGPEIKSSVGIISVSLTCRSHNGDDEKTGKKNNAMDCSHLGPTEGTMVGASAHSASATGSEVLSELIQTN